MDSINEKQHSLARRVLDYIRTEPLIKQRKTTTKAILHCALAELDSPTGYSEDGTE